MCESVFATLECELLDRVTLRHPAEGQRAVFGVMEGWDSPTGRHSALNSRSPMEFERQHPDRARPAGDLAAQAVA